MDAWLIAAVASELRGQWAGARVDRVVQPSPHDIYLQLRRPGSTGVLLLSAHPQLDRAHLVPDRPAASPTPPIFCQVLRRHLEGARLLDCRQPGLERVLEFRLQGRDELGNPRQLRLVAELTGRLANLVLAGPDGRVVDALRRVDESVNRFRETLPGLPYAPPPRPAGKVDPVLALAAGGAAALVGALEAAWAGRDPGEAPVARLQGTVFGLTRPLAEAVAAWAAGEPGGPPPPPLPGASHPLAAAVAALAAAVAGERFAPCLLTGARGRQAAAWPLPGSRAEPAASASIACASAYADLASEAGAQALRQRLSAALRAAHLSCARRLEKQREELRAAGEAERWREHGELLLCYPQHVARGADAVVLPTLTDPPRLVEVALDPRLSASGNAQRLLRRYQKEKRAASAVAARLAGGEDEMRYLEEAELALEQAEGAPELEALGAELEEQGVLAAGRRRAGGGTGRAGGRRRARGGPARRSEGRGRGGAGGGPGRASGGSPGRPAGAGTGRAPAAPPLAFAAGGGWEVLVGRNAAGNDHLTMRLGRPEDIWLHARRMPGSHVLLRPPSGGPGADPPEDALLAAARCAAYYSAGRAGDRIPVDWTRRRRVWKPAGARPGFVLYEGERTVIVDPAGLPPRAERP